MTIRAVFFDMGGTIETFRYTPEMRLHATPELRQKLVAAGIELPLNDQQLFELVNEGWGRYHKYSIRSMDELPVDKVWREFILPGFPVDSKILSAVAEKLMVYLELTYYHREMRIEVPGVLEELRQTGYKIGLISNVCSRSQVPQSLESYGLRQYFDPLILSSQYGRRKPDPSIFHHAAQSAGVPTSECLYVGDRIARDIVGARRAGYGYAVQIINEFDHGEKDEGATPDAVIRQMTELLDFIRFISAKERGTVRRERKIRALLFDAGDILYHRPNRGQHLSVFLEQLGLSDRELPADEANTLKCKAYHGEISPDQYREKLIRLHGIADPLLIERGKKALVQDEDNIQFIDGVADTLRTFKAEGFLLGVVTDTAAPLHIKLDWFERGGFGDVWDSVVSSREVGIQKPDPLIFNASLAQLGVGVDQAVFIGHSPEELQGARGLGMKTIAFNFAQPVQADFHIKKFPDLLDVPILALKETKVTGEK